ncbi:uncharacterized protein LOC127810182 [Diospyros lotus]|uniref:uncharacterized protein LOC127810182 n=1 Tax=Diospyros lotus TaxID=55363 RepID=UPI0022587C88|nr:uncharacterized protein LOC127810182 [Diospyros lotus]
MGLSLSASRRVSRCFSDSPDFNSACDSEFEACLSLTQHAFQGVRPYQLHSAANRLHRSLHGTHPLVSHWLPAPPTRSQTDRAYVAVVSRRSGKEPSDDESLGRAEFRAFAVEVFTEAVVANARKALLRRVPIGVAGIAGIGVVSRSGKDLVAAAIGIYALAVATNVYLSLAA